MVPKVLTGNAVEYVIQLPLCTSWNLDTKGRSVCYSVWHRERTPEHGIDRDTAWRLWRTRLRDRLCDCMVIEVMGASKPPDRDDLWEVH